jgi:hypothetical protein
MSFLLFKIGKDASSKIYSNSSIIIILAYCHVPGGTRDENDGF